MVNFEQVIAGWELVVNIKSFKKMKHQANFFRQFRIFSRIWTEYGDLQSKFPYSLKVWRNTGQTNPECEHFSRS